MAILASGHEWLQVLIEVRADPHNRAPEHGLSRASPWAHSNLLIDHFIINDIADANRTQSAKSMKIHSLSMFPLSVQGISNAYHITTATIHAEYFVAHAKVAQVRQILEYPHKELSMEDNIRVLVLCVNDFSPTDFTTLKKFQRTFHGNLVYGLFSAHTRTVA